MTKFKKFASIAVAGCMALSSLAMTAGAADAAGNTNTSAETEVQEQVLWQIMSPKDRAAIMPLSSFTEQTFLPKANSTGTNGNVCGEFVADAKNVVFTMNSAPGAITYNVRLCKVTASGATSVSTHGSVPIGVGVAFKNLQQGATYHFVVSSSDLSVYGTTAEYTVETY